MVVRPGKPESQAEFARLREAFRTANPGHDVAWCDPLESVTAAASSRVVFVQRAAEGSHVNVGDRTSAVVVGDVIVLRPGQTAVSEGDLGALVFSIPGDPPAGIPSFVRPDHDPRITDTPGGCAEDADAYRRVLITWERRNGPFVWHAINAHRVRMDDSFTHYHPVEGGFDELYLVQGVGPSARVVTSAHTRAILEGDAVTREQADSLLRSTPLTVGDLVYLPRGVTHRGLGGVLAQVITIPGFRPGAEIGVDRQILAINRRLGLAGDEALPFHRKAGPDIDGAGIEVELQEDGARITIDGELFTALRTADYHVPILHPVLGPGGVRVTRGYPMEKGPNEAEDHPHHRGLWFTHGDVNGIDFWSDRGERAGRIDVSAIRRPEPNVVEFDAEWRDHEDKAVLTERRSLRFGRIGADRAIDVTVTVRASAGEVRFGDTKEGTMAIRFAPELRLEGPVAQGRIVDSAGRRDGEVWGKRALWVDYSGRIGEREVGVVLFDHPDNPGHPCYWHARGYGLLAANPFGAHDFAGLPDGSGDFVVPANQSVTFRYRFLIHGGSADPVGIMTAWRRFASP
jgi:hypothetical protein